jgi:hypothetical protein
MYEREIDLTGAIISKLKSVENRKKNSRIYTLLLCIFLF